MKTIAIYSSQNLIQSPVIWNQFKDKYTLVFKEYGAWVGDFVELSTEENYIFFILDFKDLYTEDFLLSCDRNSNDLELAIDQIIYPVLELIKKSPKNIVIGKMSSAFLNFSPIRQARLQSVEQKITEYTNQKLQNAIRLNDSAYLLDLDICVLELGINQFYDNRNYYSARCRYSLNGLKKISATSFEFFNRFLGARKKVLVLDCDNTLWGGVVGEVGLEGIQIGQDGIGTAFLDFQKKIKRLKENGIILAISSKNNFENVKEVFDSHKGMGLRWDDFSSFQINWNEKSVSLREIAKELNLGLESFIFWDDNPLERELVAKNLPMVEIVDGSRPVYEWPSMLENLSSLAQFVITNEDLQKSEQYRIGNLFQEGINQAVDKKSYLKLINLKPIALDVDNNNMDRAIQLCHKTNQFNLRTIRYEKEDVRKMLNNPNYIVKLFSLSDKFGDHGIIAMGIVQIDGSIAFLDTLLMSCRVLGRYMESWILEYFRLELLKLGVEHLTGEWIKSEKNEMCKSFLEGHNFICQESSEATSSIRYIYKCDQAFPNLEVFNG